MAWSFTGQAAWPGRVAIPWWQRLETCGRAIGPCDWRRFKKFVQGLTNPTDAIPALVAALEDQDEKVRIAAARQVAIVCLHAIRSDTNASAVGQAAIALARPSRDPAPMVRIESARSLGIIGGIGFAVPRRGAGGGRGRGGAGGKSPVDARVLADLFKELAGDSDAGVRLWSGKHWGLSVPSWGSSCLKS